MSTIITILIVIFIGYLLISRVIAPYFGSKDVMKAYNNFRISLKITSLPLSSKEITQLVVNQNRLIRFRLTGNPELQNNTTAKENILLMLVSTFIVTLMTTAIYVDNAEDFEKFTATSMNTIEDKGLYFFYEQFIAYLSTGKITISNNRLIFPDEMISDTPIMINFG